MRQRYRTQHHPIPIENAGGAAWKNLRRFLLVAGALAAVYLYVFVLSPASCSNVKKKIDQTVQQNASPRPSVMADATPAAAGDVRARLDLQVPAELTGETAEDVLVREQLSARTVTGRVQKREKFTQSLTRNGVDLAEALRLIGAFESRNVFNFSRAQPGQMFTIQMSEDGTRVYGFEYHYSASLKFIAQRTAKGFDVQKVSTPVKTAVWLVGVRLSTTLQAAFSAVGEDAQLARMVQALLRDELEPSDFAAGDSVRLLVEKKTMGRKFLAYGSLLAVVADTRKKGSFAVFRGLSGNYYTADGLSFFRRFLSRPLPGDAPAEPDSRTGGVVFPAYRNPPVWALSGGRVLESGWAGPLGRRVVVEHEDGIRATYYQLGSIASDIRPGVLVNRRQVIGTAGFSGTTPDRNGVGVSIMQNGQPVSLYALSTSRLAPLPADALGPFSRQVEEYRRLLNSAEPDGLGVARPVDAAAVSAKPDSVREKKPSLAAPRRSGAPQSAGAARKAATGGSAPFVAPAGRPVEGSPRGRKLF